MADFDDSRLSPLLRDRKEIVTFHGQVMDRVFCVSCSRPGGASTKDTTHLIYVCQSCCDTHGEPPLPRAEGVPEPTPINPKE